MVNSFRVDGWIAELAITCTVRVFHKLAEIDNIGNIDIGGFTT